MIVSSVRMASLIHSWSKRNVETLKANKSDMPEGLTIEDHCRSCGSSNLCLLLDLGKTPLANSLIAPDEDINDEKHFPLTLHFCSDCSLVQIRETVSPHILFSKYLYFSSFSDTMLEAASRLVQEIIGKKKLASQNLVIEIASNDGYLLKNYLNAGVKVLGIEPAANIAQAASSSGINTICEFFSKSFADSLAEQGYRADVLHANNVLAHVADLNGFVAGIAALLADSGLAVIEVPYVRDMIDSLEFDTIYHEHLCYFSLSALCPLFARHGLYLNDVERLPIHGGSLRLFISRVDEQSEQLSYLLKQEQSLGLTQQKYYDEFAAKINALGKDLTALLQDLKKEGRVIAAYGASAKGSTLLNFFGIDGKIISFIVDRSTVKQKHLTPGTHLKILSPDELLTQQPDYVLLLTWNFSEEIVRQQQPYLEKGGRFIIPLPSPKIVEK